MSTFGRKSGTATLSSNGETLRELGPGDAFGEIAVVASGRRTAGVVASTPLRLVGLFKCDVWKRREATARARRRAPRYAVCVTVDAAALSRSAPSSS